MRKSCLLLLATTVMLAGCRGNVTKDTFYCGNVENGIYSNDYFGFTMSVPEHWEYADEQQLEAVHTEAASAVEETGIDDVSIVLMFFGGDYDSTVGYRTSLQIVAENIKLTGSRDIRKYIASALKVIEAKSSMRYDNMSPDIRERSVGGVDFYAYTLTASQIPISQTFCMALRGDFALLFILSYSDDTQLAELEEVLDGVVFK